MSPFDRLVILGAEADEVYHRVMKYWDDNIVIKVVGKDPGFIYRVQVVDKYEIQDRIHKIKALTPGMAMWRIKNKMCRRAIDKYLG